jgi:hypothetical protein
MALFCLCSNECGDILCGGESGKELQGKKVAILLLVFMAGILASCFWVESNVLNKLGLDKNEITRLSKLA